MMNKNNKKKTLIIYNEGFLIKSIQEKLNRDLMFILPSLIH